jgi:hypothetical protein
MDLVSAGFAPGFMIISVILLVLLAFALIIQWRIYTKASQPGWACFIPVYNIIVYLRIIGRSPSWLLLYIACIAIYFCGAEMLVRGSATGALLSIISGMVLLVISIIDTHRLSKSFGKESGFTIGLVLMNIVFLAILAFGKSVYIGPNGSGAMNNDNPEVLHN